MQATTNRPFQPVSLVIESESELHTVRCALSSYHNEVCSGRHMGGATVAQNEQRNQLEQMMMVLDEATK